MSASGEILKLVERFEDNLEAYKTGQYNETQVRREFLDPFFKGLGWDVDNEKGYAEAYKDVIHEDQIKVGGAMKAPDYCFRIGGTPQERTSLERQIAATDSQIDHLVYDLYGLTEDEIKIVEGKSEPAKESSTTPDEPLPLPGSSTKPKRRSKPAYAQPPPAPVHPSLTPEQAVGDAAHFYSGKEEPPPYGKE